MSLDFLVSTLTKPRMKIAMDAEHEIFDLLCFYIIKIILINNEYYNDQISQIDWVIDYWICQCLNCKTWCIEDDLTL